MVGVVGTVGVAGMVGVAVKLVSVLLVSVLTSWLHSIPQVWNLTNCRLKTNHYGHTGYLNCVTVSPDGSLCASGGKVRGGRG